MWKWRMIRTLFEYGPLWSGTAAGVSRETATDRLGLLLEMSDNITESFPRNTDALWKEKIPFV